MVMVLYVMVWYGMSLTLVSPAWNQSPAISFDLLKVLVAVLKRTYLPF